ncbi:alpha/beta fold hydrolase [Eisenbergiella sp.]
MMEYYVKEAASYMRYQDLPGEKPLVLFIHGLGCAGSFDYPQVAAQSGLVKHRRILVDLLGAGYSDKPDSFDYRVSSHALYLKSFVDYLGAEEVIIFGHSMGGAVAIELAAMCTEKVSHLILSESNLDPSAMGSASHRIASFTENYFVGTGFQEIIDENKKNGNTMWAAALANWLPAAAYGLSLSAVKGGEPSWRKALYELPVPKGFIFGERTLPDDDYEELKLYGIHVEVVENAGHSMAWENPCGLARAICGCMEA